jgi:hypothetical protein
MEQQNQIIAYCGIVCSECSAYLATQKDDPSALEQVVAQWKAEYNWDNITIQDVTCDGCLDPTKRKSSHCGVCDIRACGIEHGVVNCAHCSDYTCDKLEKLFNFAPDLREGLARIRASLDA